MAKKTAIHQITIYGDYLAYGKSDPEKMEVKQYEETVFMDEKTVREYGAIHTFLAVFAKPLLKAKDPLFDRVWHHYVKETLTDGEEPTDLALMNRKQLISTIKDDEQLEIINPVLYEDNGELVQAIMDCRKSPQMFTMYQNMLMKRKSNAIPTDALLALNKDKFDASGNVKAATAVEEKTYTDEEVAALLQPQTADGKKAKAGKQEPPEQVFTMKDLEDEEEVKI